jgi:two-component system chemotaxis response regulator CheY
MEPMTGFDLLKHVRANDATATTPFILVTAESKPENVLAAQKAGVSNYLIKPFSAPVLKEKIDSVLTAA